MKNKKRSMTVILLAILCIVAMTLTGCIKIHINEHKPTVEEMMGDQQLVLDPVDYSEDGTYTVTVHYDQGGFEQMDLKTAFVAYYPVDLLDQKDAITEDDIQKIAIVTIVTMDDNTLELRFTDDDKPLDGKAYCFIIPTTGLAGSVVPGV